MLLGHDAGCAVGVRQLFPLGGPFLGNTAVTVTGRAFRDLGDVKCRFGIDEVQARLVNETTVVQPTVYTNLGSLIDVFA